MLALAYVLLLAVVALEVPLGLSVRQRVDEEVSSQARAQADVLAASAADLLAPGRRAELQSLVTASARSVRGRVLVVDAGGRLVADSAGTALLGASYAARPEVARALAGHADQRTRPSRTLGENLLATAVPVRRNPGRPIGAVRVTQSVAAVHRAVRRTIVGLALIGALVLGMGLLAGAVIAATVARPLRRLGSAAESVAAGDLGARASVEGSTEQRALARTFNEMTERVARLLRGQQDFVADASHQLRTPLTGLRLRIEEAHAVADDPSAARAELEAGMAEADRLARIVDELLVLSRAGERQLPGERVDLAAAARRAAERWAPAAAAQGQDVVATAGGAGSAWCAPADLDRVLDVLVENALRYAPTDTVVRVLAGPSSIEVLDAGPGPAPGEEEAVFERFHRGRSGRAGPPGSGLGLAIARELASEWGATVTLEGGAGGGGRAAVRFGPVSTRGAARRRPQEDHA
ncbi:MAG: sensor histidine kinase [Solirubrobacteraceae bacterium]